MGKQREGEREIKKLDRPTSRTLPTSQSKPVQTAPWPQGPGAPSEIRWLHSFTLMQRRSLDGTEIQHRRVSLPCAGCESPFSYPERCAISTENCQKLGQNNPNALGPSRAPADHFGLPGVGRAGHHQGSGGSEQNAGGTVRLPSGGPCRWRIRSPSGVQWTTLPKSIGIPHSTLAAAGNGVYKGLKGSLHSPIEPIAGFRSIPRPAKRGNQACPRFGASSRETGTSPSRCL